MKTIEGLEKNAGNCPILVLSGRAEQRERQSSDIGVEQGVTIAKNL
ncbi:MULTISPECIES: hypothetical protein [Falsihalocynthiibacter]